MQFKKTDIFDYLKKNAWQKTLYAKTKDNTLEENICKYILDKALISLIHKEL